MFILNSSCYDNKTNKLVECFREEEEEKKFRIDFSMLRGNK